MAPPDGSTIEALEPVSAPKAPLRRGSTLVDMTPKKEKNRQASRVGKQNVSAHFDEATVAALHALLDREGQMKRRRVTVQGAVARGLQLFFEERHEEVPTELVHLAERPIQNLAARNGRKPGLS